MRPRWLAVPILALGALLLWGWHAGDAERAARARPPPPAGTLAGPHLPSAGEAHEAGEQEAPRAERQPPGVRLELRVRDTGGRPVPGVRAFLALPRKERIAEETTGRDGVALFPNQPRRGIWGWLDLEVPTPIGRFAPRAGRTMLDAIVAPPRLLTLELITDGRPGIPDELRIDLPTFEETFRDPGAGILRGSITLSKSCSRLEARVEAPGFRATPGTIEVTSQELRTVVRLDSTVELVVRARDGERVGLVLDSVETGDPPGMERSQSFYLGEGGYRAAVVPGIHRIRTNQTLATLAEFEIDPGMQRHEVELDLSRMREVELLVRLPASVGLGRVRLHISGEGVAATLMPRPWGGSYGNPVSFVFQVPGDRLLRLEPRHPLLRPHPQRGIATTVDGENLPVLEMIPASLLRFALEARVATPPLVRLHAPGEAHRALSELPAVGIEGAWAVAGWAAGTYDVWIDPRATAPVLLANLYLPEEGLDLGTLHPERGSTVRLRLGPETAKGELQSFVVAGGPRGISRVFELSGSTFRARGLPAGRYTLEVVRPTWQDGEMRVEFEVDGVNDTTIDLP